MGEFRMALETAGAPLKSEQVSQVQYTRCQLLTSCAVKEWATHPGFRGARLVGDDVATTKRPNEDSSSIQVGFQQSVAWVLANQNNVCSPVRPITNVYWPTHYSLVDPHPGFGVV